MGKCRSKPHKLGVALRYEWGYPLAMIKYISILIMMIFCESSVANKPWWDALIEPVQISYRVEFFPTMSDQEFSSLRRIVQGSSAHPLREKYERERARRENGFQATNYAVWADSDGVVRFNRVTDSEEGYVDIALDGDEVWSLTPAYLTVVLASNDNNAESPDLKDHLVDIEWKMSWFFSHGRTLVRNIPVGAWKPGVEPGRWTATGEGLVVGLTQTPTEKEIIVEIEACEPDPSQIGTRWVFRGEQAIPGMSGVVIPSSMDWVLPDGRKYQRWVIGSVETVSQETVASIRRRPEINGSDPIRGKARFHGVTDFTGRVAMVSFIGNNGDIETITELETPTARSQGKVRLVGWLSAGSLVVILAYVRYKRS